MTAFRNVAAEGPFGQIPMVRGKPVPLHPDLERLPEDCEHALKQVRTGEKGWAVLLSPGRAYLVLSRPGGRAEEGRRYGYVVHKLDLPAPFVPPRRGASAARRAASVALAFAAGAAVALGVASSRPGLAPASPPSATNLATNGPRATTTPTSSAQGADAWGDVDAETQNAPGPPADD